jgi:uncharacterized phage infection (PIP) family protein YhgE
MAISRLVRASAGAMGLVLGLIALAAGAVLIVLAFASRGGIDRALDTLAGGLENARSAVSALSSGASSSTDLVTEVRSSLEASGEVLQETGTALQSTRSTVQQLESLSATAADELQQVSRSAAMVIGRDGLGATIGQLRQSSSTSQELAQRLDTLRTSILYLRDEVVQVATAVEVLEEDMFSTEAAFGEAETHLRSASEATERLAGSGVAFWVVFGLGCLVLLTGLHSVLLSLSLFAQLRSESRGDGGR